jgi:hypothetical protein
MFEHLVEEKNKLVTRGKTKEEDSCYMAMSERNKNEETSSEVVNTIHSGIDQLKSDIQEIRCFVEHIKEKK